MWRFPGSFWEARGLSGRRFPGSFGRLEASLREVSGLLREARDLCAERYPGLLRAWEALVLSDHPFFLLREPG